MLQMSKKCLQFSNAKQFLLRPNKLRLDRSNSNSAGCFMVVDGEFGLVARAGGRPVGWGVWFFVDWAYAF